MPNQKSSDLIALLHADCPAPERAEALKLYGQDNHHHGDNHRYMMRPALN